MKLRSTALLAALLITAIVAPPAGAAVVLPPPTLPLPTSGSFLYLNSQAGDFVGRGLEQLYTSADSDLEATLGQGPDEFHVSVWNHYGHFWHVSMAATWGQALAVGSYTGAVRTTSRTETAPGLDVGGDLRGCNTLTGQFDVHEIVFSSFGELLVFDATFEQHCEGATPALFGRIRVEYAEPTPGVTLPPGNISVPTSGSFLYLNSQPGDYVGAGREWLYTSQDSAFGVAGGASLVPPAPGADFIRVWLYQPLVRWDIAIAAPPGEPLAARSYIRAVRAWFRSAGQPGLDVGGDGRGCNDVKGKFDVDQLSFDASGRLTVFQATFEQHCEGHIPALFGRIRYEYVPTTPGVTLPQGSIAVPTSGSFLYMNSEPNEYIGHGIEQLFTSADSTITGSLTEAGGYFHAFVLQGNYVHWFNVDVAAPPGQPLAQTSYVDAVTAPQRLTGQAGLYVWGDGRAGDVRDSKFDIDELLFWPNGELKVLQATFEMRSGSPMFSPALFGRIRYEAPPPLEIAVTLSAEGSVPSKTIVATISGTASCSRAAAIDLNVTLSQVQSKRVTVTGTSVVQVACTGPSVAWSADIWGDVGAFKAGSATATVNASVCDTQCASASATRTVKLNIRK